MLFCCRTFLLIFKPVVVHNQLRLRYSIGTKHSLMWYKSLSVRRKDSRGGCLPPGGYLWRGMAKPDCLYWSRYVEFVHLSKFGGNIR